MSDESFFRKLIFESEFDFFIKPKIKKGLIILLEIFISSESFVLKEQSVDVVDKFPKYI